MKEVVVLTGAGISAESGISTFRDSGGLWENYKFEEVATYEAWEANPALVLEFYNQRRKQLKEVKPNAAHIALARLENKYKVNIITQNVDDLHERSGSSSILHLHGELIKARSTFDSSLIYTLKDWQLNLGDKCEKGYQLRPHIVWFGEEVPEIINAVPLCQKADIFIVIGTSMQVYPAAGLINYVPGNIPKYYIDPKATDINYINNLTIIKNKASIAVPELVNDLLKI
ncbi:MAG: NAD-dependent deacylase [Bacteroidales bacterium]|nr:NAD-dependent deacylase [Bacteroidales bacterium]